MFLAIKTNQIYNDDIRGYENYHQIHYFDNEVEAIQFLKENLHQGYKLFKQVNYKTEISIKID